MKRYYRSLLAVVIAFGLLAGLMGCIASEPVIDVETQGIGSRPLTPYLSCYETQVAADTWAILIDLSDNTNYPHVLTNRIILKSLRYSGNLNGAQRWHIRAGVVTGITTATTDIEWIHSSPLVRSMFFDERWQLPEHGLSLSVVNATLDRVATFEITSTAAITSSTEISTTVGVTGTVGVGDLILFMDEISDTATLDFFIDVGYDAE